MAKQSYCNPCFCWNLFDGCTSVGIWTLVYSISQLALFGWQTGVLNVFGSEYPRNYQGVQNFSIQRSNRQQNYSFTLQLTIVQIAHLISDCFLLFASIALILGVQRRHRYLFWPWFPIIIINIIATIAYCVIWWIHGLTGYYTLLTIILIIMTLINCYCFIVAVVTYCLIRKTGRDKNNVDRYLVRGPDGYDEKKKSSKVSIALKRYTDGDQNGQIQGNIPVLDEEPRAFVNENFQETPSQIRPPLDPNTAQAMNAYVNYDPNQFQRDAYYGGPITDINQLLWNSSQQGGAIVNHQEVATQPLPQEDDQQKPFYTNEAYSGSPIAASPVKSVYIPQHQTSSDKSSNKKQRYRNKSVGTEADNIDDSATTTSTSAPTECSTQTGHSRQMPERSRSGRHSKSRRHEDPSEPSYFSETESYCTLCGGDNECCRSRSSSRSRHRSETERSDKSGSRKRHKHRPSCKHYKASSSSSDYKEDRHGSGSTDQQKRLRQIKREHKSRASGSSRDSESSKRHGHGHSGSQPSLPTTSTQVSKRAPVPVPRRRPPTEPAPDVVPTSDPGLTTISIPQSIVIPYNYIDDTVSENSHQSGASGGPKKYNINSEITIRYNSSGQPVVSSGIGDSANTTSMESPYSSGSHQESNWPHTYLPPPPPQKPTDGPTDIYYRPREV